MAKDKLIYASEARKAILKADPKLAYCIDSIPGVDAVEVEKYNALREDLENLRDETRILSQKRANIFEITSAYERGMVAGIKDFAKKLCEDRVSNDPVVIAVKTELKMRGTDNANDHCDY